MSDLNTPDSGTSSGPTGLSLEADVALIALVVSLVALIVSLLQLLAALVSTADGYRKCTAATLGPWSALRRRTFLWSELRFMVRFVTPHIAIIPATVEFRAQQERYIGPSWFLTPDDGPPRSKRWFGLRWFIWSRRQVLLSLASVLGIVALPDRQELERALVESSLPQQTRLPVTVILGKKAGQVDLPKDIEMREKAGMNEERLTKALLAGKTAVQPNRDLLVSWLSLIQHIEQIYASLSTHIDRIQGLGSAKPAQVGHYTSLAFEPDSQDTITKADGSLDVESAAQVNNDLFDAQNPQTHVVVAVRFWTWDSMPADIPKPLATSTLNSIILLGLRLNMQWRRIDVESGIFNADGNGYSLSSFDIRGMGIGFRFAVTGSNTVQRACVPSEAVDKMMFGIVPDRRLPLVRRDFDLVVNGEIKFSTMLLQMGFAIELRNKLVAEHDEPKNEMVSLLCPYLPLNTSNAFVNLFPAWQGWATSMETSHS